MLFLFTFHVSTTGVFVSAFNFLHYIIYIEYRMPKITEMAKMLYSHSRNINVNIYRHHIVYSIPTYNECATPRLISLVENGCGSLILTTRRDENCKWYDQPSTFVSGKKLISGEYNRTDGDPTTTDANRSLRIHEEIWKLPL